MPLNYTQNFDGVTPPTNPSGWNLDGAYATSGSVSRSSPNSLNAIDAANIFKWATYGTSDDANGAVITGNVWVQITGSTVSGNFRMGFAYRCNASTMNNSSTRCYVANLRSNSKLDTNSVELGTITNGAYTQLATVTPSISIVGQGWFLIRSTVTGNSHSVAFQRPSDNFWMKSDGSFQSAFINAITINDSTYTSGNFYGISSLMPNTASNVFYDDFSVVTGAATGSLIRVPLDGLKYMSDLTGGVRG